MAKIGLREEFEMKTRSEFTKVDCEIGMTVQGKELPSMAVLGEALETAIEVVQAKVSESYKMIPARP